MKRICSLFVLAILLCMILTISGYAKETAYSGKCGDQLTWVLDENTETLTISGTGAMYDFQLVDHYPLTPWVDFSYCIRNVHIQEGVTSVGNFAFTTLEYYTSPTVSLPSTVTSIGQGSLIGCNAEVSANSTSFCVENGLLMNREKTSIVAVADQSLRVCVMPDTVTTLYPYAFYCADSELSEVYFSPALTVISEHNFVTLWSAGAYSHLHLPDMLTTIEDNTFINCNADTVVFPRTLEKVGKAFSGGEVKNFCFLGDAPVFAVEPEVEGETHTVHYLSSKNGWSSNWNGFKTAIWDGDPAKIDEISWELVNGMLTIRGSSHVGTNGLIQAPWWSHRGEITNLVISEGITSLEDTLWMGLDNVRTVSIPASYTDDLRTPFYRNLPGLKSIRVASGNPEYRSVNGALLSANKPKLLVVPKQTAGVYVIPDGVTEVGSQAFSTAEKSQRSMFPQP